VLKAAKANRDQLQKKLFPISAQDTRRKMHLVIRVQTEAKTPFDFIELCSSDVAATQETIASDSHREGQERTFASQTFNAISKALLAVSA
jgi:hypothetical protein